MLHIIIKGNQLVAYNQFICTFGEPLRSFTDSDLPDPDNIVPFENTSPINQNKKD